MKLVRKFLLLLVLVLFMSLISMTVAAEPKGAQKSAYPNEFEPPVSAELLKKANYKAPKMSRAMGERLAHRKLRKSEI